MLRRCEKKLDSILFQSGKWLAVPKLSHLKWRSRQVARELWGSLQYFTSFQQYQIWIFQSLSLRLEHNRYDILLMLSLKVSISICVERDERRLFYLLKDLFHRFIEQKFEWRDQQQSWLLMNLKLNRFKFLENQNQISRSSKLLKVSYADTKDVTFSAFYF